MRLEIQNFTKIKSAILDFNGITVIAGENNTEKSSIGKIVFSIFNGLYHIDEKIKEERITAIASRFRSELYDDVKAVFRREDISIMQYNGALVKTKIRRIYNE